MSKEDGVKGTGEGPTETSWSTKLQISKYINTALDELQKSHPLVSKGVKIGEIINSVRTYTEEFTRSAETTPHFADSKVKEELRAGGYITAYVNARVLTFLKSTLGDEYQLFEAKYLSGGNNNVLIIEALATKICDKDPLKINQFFDIEQGKASNKYLQIHQIVKNINYHYHLTQKQKMDHSIRTLRKVYNADRTTVNELKAHKGSNQCIALENSFVQKILEIAQDLEELLEDDDDNVVLYTAQKKYETPTTTITKNDAPPRKFDPTKLREETKKYHITRDGGSDDYLCKFCKSNKHNNPKCYWYQQLNKKVSENHIYADTCLFISNLNTFPHSIVIVDSAANLNVISQDLVNEEDRVYDETVKVATVDGSVY